MLSVAIRCELILTIDLVLASVDIGAAGPDINVTLAAFEVFSALRTGVLEPNILLEVWYVEGLALEELVRSGRHGQRIREGATTTSNEIATATVEGRRWSRWVVIREAVECMLNGGDCTAALNRG